MLFHCHHGLRSRTRFADDCPGTSLPSNSTTTSVGMTFETSPARRAAVKCAMAVRVTVGKKTLEDGAVDVRDRNSGEERRVPLAELGSVA